MCETCGARHWEGNYYPGTFCVKAQRGKTPERHQRLKKARGSKLGERKRKGRGHKYMKDL